MKRAVEWTMKARRQAPADSPLAGLLPAAPADGECLWDGKHHIVGYDFWNLRGMICAAEAARLLGHSDEADALDREAKLYREAIDAAWRRTGLAYFPPSWEKDGTDWGNLETLWPTAIFAPDDPRVAATVHHVRKEVNGGFIEGTMQWLGTKDAIHPYAGVYSVMADLVCDKDEQVAEDFYWYLLHSTSAHAFPEGILYKRNHAWGETIPHVTGACNFAFLLRHMLVHEQGDRAPPVEGRARLVARRGAGNPHREAADLFRRHESDDPRRRRGSAGETRQARPSGAGPDCVAPAGEPPSPNAA